MEVTSTRQVHFSALGEGQERLDLDLFILCSRNPLQPVFYSNNYLIIYWIRLLTIKQRFFGGEKMKQR